MGVDRNIDITARERKTILELLGRYLPNVTVWVYGSRVTWTSRPQSDLDMVVFSSPEQGMRVSGLKEALEESSLPFRVDLFSWDEVPEQFRKNIEAEHVALQEKSKVEVVSDWPTVSLSELIEPDRGISYGIVQPGPKVSNGIPIIRVKDIRNGQINTDEPLKVSAEIEASYVRTRLRGGELLLTLVGTVGETAIVPDSLSGWNIARAVAVIPVQEDVGASWVQIALNSPNVKSLIDSRLNTTVQATLNLRDVAQLPILFPPTKERQSIESIIGALDDKIELNRKMNKTLEEMAQAIFKSWFVDFEPFRDGGMVDSELDPIPKGWEIGNLGNVISIYDSKRIPLSKKQRSERPGPFPYYGATSIMDHVDDYLFDGIYVLVGEDGSVVDEQDHPVVQYVWGKFWVNNHAHVLLPREPFGIEWLVCFLRQLNIRPFITGAVQLKLNQGNLKRIPAIIPPESVCCEFNEIAGPLFSKYRANADEILTLSELRDTLLPKLISGEVRIKDAEPIVRRYA